MHENAHENNPRHIHAFSEQLLAFEEEYKTLKKITSKINELQDSTVMCARTTSMLKSMNFKIQQSCVQEQLVNYFDLRKKWRSSIEVIASIKPMV